MLAEARRADWHIFSTITHKPMRLKIKVQFEARFIVEFLDISQINSSHTEPIHSSTILIRAFRAGE
jgi:hypothetical protein